jgi:hypothetical protein
MQDFPKEVDDAARALRGNWKAWRSFGWDHASDDDSEEWAIIIIASRDSTLLEASNAAAIVKELTRVDSRQRCWRTESHNHWAVGYVENIVIRPFRKDGKVSAAFRALHSLAMALADYPCLDESDFSRREYEAACDAISYEGGSIVSDDAPEEWVGEVFSWLWDNEQSELEDRGEGQGAYPSQESISRALVALGYLNQEAA